jgi:acyl-CoA thioesterase-1
MRRVAIVPIVAVLLAFLTGCRSNESSSPSPAARTEQSPSVSTDSPPTAQPKTADEASEKDLRPRIVCFGDSLTAGYGTETGQAYPDYLQSELDRRGYSYHVINAGISGNTTKDGVERVSSIVAMKPDIVVVEFGGNDGLRGLRIADTRANLDRIVSTLTVSGTRVVLAGITLPPDYGADYIRQFNETYELLARKFHLPMLPFLLKGVFGVDGMMQPDRTHATADGNKVVAGNVLTLIEPLLKKEPVNPSRR